MSTPGPVILGVIDLARRWLKLRCVGVKLRRPPTRPQIRKCGRDRCHPANRACDQLGGGDHDRAAYYDGAVVPILEFLHEQVVNNTSMHIG